ncbi:hypothetical protein BJ508DRAFT_413054 [Ascobolus immersus RN42]|uniref:Uncharacterized protein n=1 Tax=Ascobolus immersus RN42 TaxID=1160509 RepID=A0A3N4IIP7_ASCIM|nr:hypothetical protein BJ508DRAFT_413054 [Ascobolus immersus RN42]
MKSYGGMSETNHREDYGGPDVGANLATILNSGDPVLHLFRWPAHIGAIIKWTGSFFTRSLRGLQFSTSGLLVGGTYIHHFRPAGQSGMRVVARISVASRYIFHKYLTKSFRAEKYLNHLHRADNSLNYPQLPQEAFAHCSTNELLLIDSTSKETELEPFYQGDHPCRMTIVGKSPVSKQIFVKISDLNR